MGWLSMNSFKATTLFICLCLVVLPSCSGRKSPADTKTSEATRASVQSANWKVTVDSVRKPQPGTLAISLQLEYLGPDGNVKGPVTKLTNKDGEVRPRSVGMSHESARTQGLEPLPWLGSAVLIRAMKTGDKLSPIYVFDDPEDYEGLMLTFADAPPLPVKVSSTDIKP